MRRLFILLAFLVGATSALAQSNTDIFTQRAQEQRSTEQGNTQQRQTSQAASESATALRIKSDDVTYDDVLADPDNVDLNFRWARKQILAGEVKNASATLERILMLQPALTKVRLMYGIVLFRLDDVDEAEVQLEQVKMQGAPDEQLEAQTYLSLIASRRKRAHFNASVSVGWQFDDNRDAATSSGQVLFADTPIPLTDVSQRHSDTAAILVGSLGATQDLGFQHGHSLFENFTYYQAEQTQFKNLNLKAYSGRAGGVYKTAWVDFTGTALLDHVQLSQATFLRDYGFDLRGEHHLSPRSVIFGRGAYQFQEYNPTEQLPTAGQRTGKQWDFSAGWEGWISPMNKLSPWMGYTVKDAASTWFAFRRYTLELDHTLLLPRGCFLASALTANYDRYQSPELFVSPTIERSDDTYRFRTTFGVPLSDFYKPLQGFVATAGYEYYWDISNVLNYSYTSNKISATVNYSWGN